MTYINTILSTSLLLPTRKIYIKNKKTIILPNNILKLNNEKNFTPQFFVRFINH